MKKKIEKINNLEDKNEQKSILKMNIFKTFNFQGQKNINKKDVLYKNIRSFILQNIRLLKI